MIYTRQDRKNTQSEKNFISNGAPTLKPRLVEKYFSGGKERKLEKHLHSQANRVLQRIIA